MRDTLHWIPIRQRIFYRVAVLVPGVALSSRHCPVYLQELMCRPVSTLVGRRAYFKGFQVVGQFVSFFALIKMRFGKIARAEVTKLRLLYTGKKPLTTRGSGGAS